MLRRLQHGRVPSVNGRLHAGKPPLLAGRRRIVIIIDISFGDTRKNRLQRKIIFLGNWIEFVIMAAGAVSRSTDEGGHRLRHEVIAIEVLKLHRRRISSADIEVTGSEESERHSQMRLIRKNDIGGDLLTDEPVPRRVAIETGNDIIAKPPGVGPENVVFIAMGIRKMNRIQPVPRPTLAVPRRGQQSIYQHLIGLRILALHKGFHFFRSRRQPVQVKIHAADQRTPVGRRRRPQSPAGQRRLNEAIERVSGRRRNSRFDQRPQRPPVTLRRARFFHRHRQPRVRRARRHPLLEQRHLICWKRLLRRHLMVVIRPAHHFHQQTFLRPSRHQRRPTVPALLPARLRVQR